METITKARPSEKGRHNVQKVMQSDSFEQALVELDKREEAFENTKQNPKQWFKDQGVEIPGDPTVEVGDGSLYIKLCWFDSWCITFDWP